MNSATMLLCKYKLYTVVVKACARFLFDDLIEVICKKWRIMVRGGFKLLYYLVEYPNCALEDDDNFG